MLKASDLNFVGNIEGQNLSKGMADVVVTDGFTGNIVLKTLEGVGEAFIKLKNNSPFNFERRINATGRRVWFAGEKNRLP